MTKRWNDWIGARLAFSLVEVVLALGVVAFAIVAILGILPIGLTTSHNAQDETRAAQIAQSIIASFASQAPKNFQAVALPTMSPSPAPTLDLSSSNSAPNSPAAVLYVDNDGAIIAAQSGGNFTPPANATFSVSIFTDDFSSAPSPAPFDSGFANKVTIRVVAPPLQNPNATPNPSQRAYDFVRIISKY